MADMAAGGGIDVLTGDYLAEVTMLILGKARAKDATKGYAVTFLHQLDTALDDLVANGIRVVANAGGLNPAGLAAATRELAARRGHDLRVAYVDGDDVADGLGELQAAGHPLTHLTTGKPLSSWPHRALTANAYLGGFGIARALAHGADIVVTGRVADASLVVGAAAWWWDWGPDDHDALAGAMCAGHVIECGTQATGGNFSGFRAIPDLTDAGFPIAEISPDGSSVITKHPGTGGAVTEDTVKAQLLYEIGDPAYLNVDVVTHLDTARADRPRGRPRRDPGSPRLGAATDHEGGDHRSGRVAEQRAARPHGHRSRRARRRWWSEPCTATPRPSTASTPSPSTASVEPQHDPDTQHAGTELLRIAVQGTEQAAGRAFSSHIVELGLSSYPGLYGLGPPQPGSAFGTYWPALLDQSVIDHTVHHHDGTTEVIAPTGARPTAATARTSAPEPIAPPVWSDELVEVPLGEIVHARSGDKGGDANLGVWVRDPDAWPWLSSTLTVDELRRLLPEARDLPVARYELANLGALNFVIRGLLDDGATSTLRLDAQAKALGEWLRSRTAKVPRSLVTDRRR